jgi:tRNA 5-methylaminomethyl-2-thiouridine biosynthesis bifunctional protein
MTGQTPFCPIYGEHYWGDGEPEAEKTLVFLTGNRLPERLAGLGETETLGVGELGLGTGLNFALTCALLDEVAPVGAEMTYYAYEAHPLTVEGLAEAHAGCSAPLQPVLAALRAAWPPVLTRVGWHALAVHPRVRLHLWHGPVAEGLPTQPEPVGAWFLDGFSPARNPAMWTPEVMQEVARLSTEGATAATFSVAAAVRENLMAAGFAVRKVRGFPPKRWRLEAQMGG